MHESSKAELSDESVTWHALVVHSSQSLGSTSHLQRLLRGRGIQLWQLTMIEGTEGISRIL